LSISDVLWEALEDIELYQESGGYEEHKERIDEVKNEMRKLMLELDQADEMDRPKLWIPE